MELQIGVFEMALFLFVGFVMGYVIGVFRESLWYSKHNLDVRNFYHEIYENMSKRINKLQDQLTKKN